MADPINIGSERFTGTDPRYTGFDRSATDLAYMTTTAVHTLGTDDYETTPHVDPQGRNWNFARGFIPDVTGSVTVVPPGSSTATTCPCVAGAVYPIAFRAITSMTTTTNITILF